MKSDEHRSPADGAPPLRWVLLVTFLGSLGTGVFWHGLAFIAKHSYGFSERRNFVLYAVMGIIYTIGAWRAGAVTRWAGRWIAPRGVLGVGLATQAAACTLPVTLTAEWAVWLASGVVSFTASIMWPIIESYITSGRHGPQMRSALGWFNLVWMTAMPVPLLVMAPILEHHGTWAIGGLAVGNTFALIALPRLAARPAAHDATASADHVAPEYPLLLRSARVLLPLSYVLTGAMAPILPFLFQRLEVAVSWETPATATWMVVRVVALLIMWRAPFWHGRWGTLLLGALLMTGGFALVVIAPGIEAMLIGFAGLGAGLGIVYYAALYYAMSVGLAEVDAGGTHEALIGAGYAAGPLAGLAGTTLAGGAGVVGIVWAVVGLAAVPAITPYARARRRRPDVTDRSRGAPRA
ncbi:MAG: hypothetical protein ACYTGC_03810 [Planctomycetota bacterium]|jgi:hypothetical protein